MLRLEYIYSALALPVYSKPPNGLWARHVL